MTNKSHCSPVPFRRMAAQCLSTPWPDDPASLVAWMGAVQAQDTRMARWALGLRMQQPDRTVVDKAFCEGRIVRMHLLRPTWHLVAREDVRWMLRLCADRLRATNDSYARSAGLAFDERFFLRAHDVIARALEGGRSMTREQIGALLARKGMPSDGNAVRRILMRGETDGVLCSGPDLGRNPTYALLDERVPGDASVPTGDEALGLLALRYFRSHAPATLADFVWWSGLPLREARRAVWLCGDPLAEELFDGTGEPCIVCRAFRSAAEDAAAAHLLPAYDEYLIAYRERSHVLDAHHRAAAFNAWGIFRPVVLVGGLVAGNWTHKGACTKASDLCLFADAPAVSDRSLEAAVARFRAFCGE